MKKLFVIKDKNNPDIAKILIAEDLDSLYYVDGEWKGYEDLIYVPANTKLTNYLYKLFSLDPQFKNLNINECIELDIKFKCKKIVYPR